MHDQSVESFAPPVLNADEYEDYDVHPRRFATHRSRVVALLLGAAVLAAIGVGTYFAMEKEEVHVKKEDPPLSTNSALVDEITLEELAAHDNIEDCWQAILGSVYDLTLYAPEHPGGAFFITDHCGVDSTAEYGLFHEPVLLNLIPHTKVGSYVDTKQIALQSSPPSNAQTALPTAAPKSNPSVGPSTFTSSELTTGPTTEPSFLPSYVPTSPPTVMSSNAPSIPKVPSLLSPSLPTPQTPYLQDLWADLFDENLLGNSALVASPTLPPLHTRAPAPSASVPTPSNTSPVFLAPVTQAPETLPPVEIQEPAVIANPTLSPTIRKTSRPTQASTTVPTDSPTVSPITSPPTPRPTLRPTPRPTPQPVIPPTLPPTDPPIEACFTLAEIQQHASRDDCWYILYSRAYDFTNYM